MFPANLKTFGQAVADALKADGKEAEVAKFMAKADAMSIEEAREFAKAAGVEFFFDWDAPRTREGYYRYQGGTKCCTARAAAFANYADMLWMETKSPIYAQAKEFAQGVKAIHPVGFALLLFCYRGF